MTDFNELRVNNSSHTKGTSYLSSKRVNGCQGDGFSSMGIRMATKTRNDWYLGLVAPISSIVGLLILYS